MLLQSLLYSSDRLMSVRKSVTGREFLVGVGHKEGTPFLNICLTIKAKYFMCLNLVYFGLTYLFNTARSGQVHIPVL